MDCYPWRRVLIPTHNPGYATSVVSMPELYDEFLPVLVEHGEIRLVFSWKLIPSD